MATSVQDCAVIVGARLGPRSRRPGRLPDRAGGGARWWRGRGPRRRGRAGPGIARARGGRNCTPIEIGDIRWGRREAVDRDRIGSPAAPAGPPPPRRSRRRSATTSWSNSPVFAMASERFGVMRHPLVDGVVVEGRHPRLTDDHRFSHTVGGAGSPTDIGLRCRGRAGRRSWTERDLTWGRTACRRATTVNDGAPSSACMETPVIRSPPASTRPPWTIPTSSTPSTAMRLARVPRRRRPGAESSSSRWSMGPPTNAVEAGAEGYGRDEPGDTEGHADEGRPHRDRPSALAGVMGQATPAASGARSGRSPQ